VLSDLALKSVIIVFEVSLLMIQVEAQAPSTCQHKFL
ncbi:MAG: hypothetical protein RLZZ113_1632, partial [Pseudomonadota bacterium]